MEKSYYAIIPANVRYDKELNGNAKLLYGEITALANSQGYCWATNGYFAELYQVSERTITRMIASLESKGYINSIVIKDGYKTIRHIYLAHVDKTVHVDVDKNVHVDADKVVHLNIDKNVYPEHDKNVYHNNTTINNTKNNTINNTDKKTNKKKSDLENQFESLWKEYPRKLGSKKKARESYVKAIKSGNVTYEQVQYGIEMYKKYIDYHNISEEFIKHGSTWFNQECWSNDYTCKPKVIQGKRHGFLGLVLNEMDYEKANSNVIDYEEPVINGQKTSGSTISHVTDSLPFGL